MACIPCFCKLLHKIPERATFWPMILGKCLWSASQGLCLTVPVPKPYRAIKNYYSKAEIAVGQGGNCYHGCKCPPRRKWLPLPGFRHYFQKIQNEAILVCDSEKWTEKKVAYFPEFCKLLHKIVERETLRPMMLHKCPQRRKQPLPPGFASSFWLLLKVGHLGHHCGVNACDQLYPDFVILSQWPKHSIQYKNTI